MWRSAQPDYGTPSEREGLILCRELLIATDWVRCGPRFTHASFVRLRQCGNMNVQPVMRMLCVSILAFSLGACNNAFGPSLDFDGIGEAAERPAEVARSISGFSFDDAVPSQRIAGFAESLDEQLRWTTCLGANEDAGGPEQFRFPPMASNSNTDSEVYARSTVTNCRSVPGRSRHHTD